jgi:hypothetical protein
LLQFFSPELYKRQNIDPRLEEFRDRFKLGKDNSTARQYEYDNSTSPECNDIMKQFESSTFSQVT